MAILAEANSCSVLNAELPGIHLILVLYTYSKKKPQTPKLKVFRDHIKI